MRKVFKKVKLGKDYGLSSSDIRLIRRSDPGDIGLLAMQGHYNSIDTLLDEGSSNAMQIAGLLDKARDAEFAAKDRFYRRSVSQLSPQGQAILADHFNEYLLKKTSIESREHTTIATDIPEYLIEFASRSNERIQMRLARMGIKS